MNRSVQDVGGGLLVVSQFTLAADVAGGNRPSFTQAAAPEDGRRLYEHFVAQARAAHPVVQTGQFAADMKVSLVNDGPITIPMRMSA
jgi:D-tyrosyl-tRNA(Tyr) deacylase